ncbi:MAG: protein kinase [Planctomycetota bacterium]
MNQANFGQPAVTTLTAKPGDKVDNYTIMEQVGAGGTAVVFRAQDHVLNRDVAIKQIIVPAGDTGDEIRQRAVAEASLHKQVAASDPKLLVQFIDIINDDRGLFLISELVDGPSLEGILQQEPRPMDQRQALGIVAASAKALDAVHRHNMVHRDLKPSNILMPREGGLKLADFGLAAVVSEQQAMDVGSVRYMAPETLRGEPATAKSDLYALGIVAYEMLAGREKFDESFRTILRDQRNQAMRWVKWHTNVRAKATPLNQLIPGIPESLSALVERMMEKDPARRVGSSSELLEAIRMHFAGDSAENSQHPAGPKPHAAMNQPVVTDVSETAAVPQRSKIPLILVVMLLGWGVLIGGFFVWQGQQKDELAQLRIDAIQADLEGADRLHFEEKYAEAAAAFAAIPETHTMTNKGHYLYELCSAGVLRSEGMLAIEAGDFITAVSKFDQYASVSLQWEDEEVEAGPNVKLSHEEAKRLSENNEQRKTFQLIADGIRLQIREGNLDGASQEIQRQRDRDPAEQDLATLARLEQQLKQIKDLQRLTNLFTAVGERIDSRRHWRNIRGFFVKYQPMISSTQGLFPRVSADDLEEAVDELDSITNESLAANPTVIQLAQALGGEQRKRRIDRRVEDAIADKDWRELEDALEDRQREFPDYPNEAAYAELKKIKVQELLDEASAALAANEPDRADGMLTQVLELDPNNAQAVQMRTRIAGARMQVAARARGDRLMADGDYAGAITAYKQALEHGPDLDGQIQAKIQQANGRIAQAAAEDALDAGNLDQAKQSLAAAILLLGRTAELLEIESRIGELDVYRTTVAQGDDLFMNKSFGSAKRKYIEAQAMFDSETIREKIRLCDFNVWLQQCDTAIAQRDWIDAESKLMQAEEILVNDQTRARRETIENRVQ